MDKFGTIYRSNLKDLCSKTVSTTWKLKVIRMIRLNKSVTNKRRALDCLLVKVNEFQLELDACD